MSWYRWHILIQSLLLIVQILGQHPYWIALHIFLVGWAFWLFLTRDWRF